MNKALNPALRAEECREVLLSNPGTVKFVADLVAEPMPDWFLDDPQQYAQRLGS